MANENFGLILGEIVELARCAGAEIMSVYTHELDIEWKQDNSPITLADTKSHQCIEQGLNGLSERYPILSEEGRSISFFERRAWKRCWLVDPLDGTKEFIRRNDEFTVNIALIEDGIPILGVVHAPALNVTYFAAIGIGAFKQSGMQEPKRIHTQSRDHGGPYRVVASRSHMNADTERFIHALGEVDMLSMGSALKMCLIAEGVAHLYPRLSPTSEWDTAAAHCVVNQSGGKVVTIGLNELTYNTNDSLVNPSFIACYRLDSDWSDKLQIDREVVECQRR